MFNTILYIFKSQVPLHDLYLMVMFVTSHQRKVLKAFITQMFDKDESSETKKQYIVLYISRYCITSLCYWKSNILL